MKINVGLTEDVPRMPKEMVTIVQSHMVWPCSDILGYRVNENNEEGKVELLLVERKEPPVKGVLWFPGGRRLKNVGLEDFVARKLYEECGIDIGEGDGIIIRQLPTRDASFSSDLPNVPGENYSLVENGFHAVSTNYVVEISSRARISLDKTSSRYQWLDIPSLLEYGRDIGGFHPYFAEVVNDGAEEIGLSPKLTIKDVNTEKYGNPLDNFDR
ncbi:hypothetical protein J4462_01610 [Candidatus Pacearchaeota archaeon]|nr:hypothetical protein [Candidatus Pacearchaeota archaeon]